MSADSAWDVLGKRLLVRPDDREERIGSVLLPQQAQEDVVRGTILAVGSDIDNSAVQVDRRVLFSKYGGVQVTLDGQDLLVLHEVDVLLVERT